MAPDEGAGPGITKDQLAEREEANLRFPGSRLVEEKGYDEGEGWGFDGVLMSAMLNRRWSVDAEREAVLAWYRNELTARGWKLEGSTPTVGPVIAEFYSRGPEQFTVRMFGRMNRPAWLYWPPAEGHEMGLHYDITFSDQSKPP